MKYYCVYILTNITNRVLYVGVTNSLHRRGIEHKEKLIEGFTKKYNVSKLVYFKAFTDIKKAISVEKKLKGWTRIKKIELIESMNPGWDDLFPISEKYIYSIVGESPKKILRSHRATSG